MDQAEIEDSPARAADDQQYESDSSSPSGTDSLTWIAWFCSLPGHEYFAEVAEDFIEDDFNLTGLNSLVPFYKEALEMILDVEPEEESLKIPDVSIVESSAELLYGLIHQRYIITRQGLQQMVHKYDAAHFGYCPRFYCNSMKVLPCGRSDLLGVDTVKLYCPQCTDAYTPPSSRFNDVDGAFFGTTFPHLLYQSFRDQLPPNHPLSTAPGAVGPSHNRSPGLSPAPEASTSASASPSLSGAASPRSPSNFRAPAAAPAAPVDPDAITTTTIATSANRIYVPRIYGFRVSERARSGPRMAWLRMKPRDDRELDRVDFRGGWRGGWGRAANVARVEQPSSAQRQEKFDEDVEEEGGLEEDEEEEEEQQGTSAAAGKKSFAANGA